MAGTCPIEGAERLPDLTAIAGGYSTLAAVLSGFAFSGLVLLLTVRMFPDAAAKLDMKLHSAALSALLAAFISLAISAANYAFLSGLTETPGPLASQAAVYGQAFTLATMQLIYAILLSLAAAERSGDQPAREEILGGFRTIAIGIIAIFLALAMAEGSDDYTHLHLGSEGMLPFALWGSVVATVLVGAWLITDRVRGFAGSDQPVRWASPLATGVVGAVTLITFLPTFDSSETCHTASTAAMATTAALAGMGLVVLTWAVGRFGGAHPVPRSGSQDRRR